MTSDIVELMYERDYLKRKALQVNSTEIWNKYTYMRNKVTQLIRVRKKEYACSAISDHKNDCRKMWKTLNNLTGRDKRKESSWDIDHIEYNEFFNNRGETILFLV